MATSTLSLKNKTYLVMGFAGCGKSTLSNCILNRSGELDRLNHPFKVASTTESVTTEYRLHEDSNNNNIKIIDSIGFGTKEATNKDIIEKLITFLKNNQKTVTRIDAILFVIDVGRFTNSHLDFLSFVDKKLLSFFGKNSVALILTKQSSNWIKENENSDGVKKLRSICDKLYAFYLRYSVDEDPELRTAEEIEGQKILDTKSRQRSIEAMLKYLSDLDRAPLEVTKLISGPPCFPPSALVHVKNKGLIKMGELVVGDYVRAMQVSKNKIKYSRFLGYLHQDTEAYVNYLCFSTTSGAKLKISPLHLIAKQSKENGKVEFVFAREIEINDYLMIAPSQESAVDEVKPEKVVGIEMESVNGLYAPLLECGNLIVDSTVASCYSNVRSHRIGHLAFMPLRFLKNEKMIEFINNVSRYQLKEYNGPETHSYAMLLLERVPFSKRLCDIY